VKAWQRDNDYLAEDTACILHPRATESPVDQRVIASPARPSTGGACHTMGGC